MEKEERFRKELATLVRLGKNQGNRLTGEQIAEAFSGLGIKEDKMPLVYAYLAGVKIAVDDAFDPEEQMQEEDLEAMDLFLREVEHLPEYSESEKAGIIRQSMEDDDSAKEKLFYMMLPKIVEIAKLYANQGVLMEDLIGEGNVALAAGIQMAPTLEHESEAESFFAGLVMDAMEVLISEEATLSEIDEKILDQVNRVATAAENLYQDLRRKVTPLELAEQTDLTEEEIYEAFRLSGEQIDMIMIPKE